MIADVAKALKASLRKKAVIENPQGGRKAAFCCMEKSGNLWEFLIAEIIPKNGGERTKPLRGIAKRVVSRLRAKNESR
jgi:hypothetical protein